MTLKIPNFALILFILLSLASCNEEFRYKIQEGNITDDEDALVIKINRISGTYAHSSHFLHPSGKLYSWGANWDGQLGNNDDPLFADSWLAVEVNASHLGLSNEFKYLATAGYYNYHMCAIHQTGKVLCWGTNWSGECGVGNLVDPCNKPTEIKMSHLTETNDFLMVTVGQDKSCALHSNQKIFCWGNNSASGELGTGDVADHIEPTEIDMTLAGVANQFKFVSVSESNGCGVHQNGKIYCWGWNSSGQLGNGTSGWVTSSLSPIEIDMSAHPEGNDFVSVAAGFHTCGIHANGKLFCWGENGAGELGIGSNIDTFLPTEVDMSVQLKINSFTEVDVSSNSTCAVHIDKSLYCWGDNGTPAISGSINPQETRPFPYDMTTQGVSNQFTNAATDSEGWRICGLNLNGLLYCSGYNSYGSLGDGTDNDTPTPIEVDMSSM